MIIINHFNKEFKLNRTNEFLLWQESVLLPTRAPSIFGMALSAKDRGLKPKIIVENMKYEYPDYRFKRYKKTDIELAEFFSKQYIKKAIDKKIPITERLITFKDVISFSENPILLRLNTGALRGVKSMSKYVAIIRKREEYSVFDPILKKPLAVSEEMLFKAFDTLLLKKKRTHRMIIF